MQTIEKVKVAVRMMSESPGRWGGMLSDACGQGVSIKSIEQSTTLLNCYSVAPP